ncbi:polysaccharide deacetylase family protein [Mesorhizobium sp. SP-1A]|uniref:polysaccharide deacetylase family protein n=1 Tax=Mesorhizobium sp. SP-1A TaxID=3077840 RepID=UPI0028F6C772|nr:polysaccharide deacetylase family protein [Mesorhizobium sp. SP-1A]
MNLLISVPASRQTALEWVAGIVFGDMLGLPFAVAATAETDRVVLSADDRSLVMPSVYPDLTSDEPFVVPAPPLAEFDPSRHGLSAVDIEASLPVIFGAPALEIAEKSIMCGIDILGSIFFMLSRHEEVVLTHRDKHDRFQATASLAYKGGFLERPVVDEYVEVLWEAMARLWPTLRRRRRQGEIRVSCDVDWPFDPVGKSANMLMRTLRYDIFRHRNPGIARNRVRNFISHRKGDYRFDPNHTFDWYMDVCELNGRRAAFYFIPDHSAGAIDGSYDIAEPRILTLIRKLADRGHEIGMHGSYNTYRDVSQIVKERGLLMKACSTAGADASVMGNRQHYLRWDAAETPDHLDNAGFEYDTTGSFADRPGFRYGTSYPFAMWSWNKKAPLRLLQRALVIMECSVLDRDYLGLGYTEKSLTLMQELKRKSMRLGGDFTLLWHNSYFLRQKDRHFFQTLVSL